MNNNYQKELHRRVVQCINILADREVQIRSEESIFDAGLFDSFAILDLVALLEREFGIQIPDSDCTPSTFMTIQKIETYLIGRVGT